MAKAFSISLKGIENANRVLKAVAAAPDKVDILVKNAAFEIESEAKRNIQRNGTKDQGHLSASGTVVTNARNASYTVWFSAYHAPFLEFGTGGKASIPSEWQELASQYHNGYSRGTFEQFISNIIDWMKRKGIQPKSGTDPEDYDNAAFFICLHILYNGLEPRPFLFPAYDKVRKLLIERIIKVYKDIR